MPAKTFEATQALLKSHPSARPVTSGRGPRSQDNTNNPPPDPERHSRKCRICKHPDREAIESDFLRWRPTAEIAQTYGLPDHSSVCRHARATGLYDQRGQGVCYALDPILEEADRVFMKLTPHSIISACEAYAKINARGHRVRPIVHNHYINTTSAEYNELVAYALRKSAPNSEHNSSRTPAPAVPSHSPLITSHCSSNRPIQELESTPSH